MLRFSRGQKTMIGISVLPENIHLVQLKHVKNDYQIVHAAQFAMPREMLVDGCIQPFSLLQQWLSDLVCEHQLQQAQTAVCVPLSLVKIQRLVVPSGLTVKDIEAEVYAEANRLLPVKSEKIAFDYQAAPHLTKEELSVFFAVTKRDYLSQYAACLRDAGLKPAVIEIDIFALLRAARYAQQRRKKETEKWAALYVTPQFGLMAARDGDELLFYKHWDEQHFMRHQVSLLQWVEWCCQAYRQVCITSVAIGGVKETMAAVREVINQHWQCEIIEIDPIEAQLSSAYLLAYGLAMREPLPWLN